MWRAVLPAWACSGLFGCGSAATSAPATLPPLGPADLRAIAAEVSVARGLPPRRPVRIEQVTDAEFARVLTASLGEDEPEPPGQLSEEAAFLLGFNFVPPPEERAAISSAQEVLEEQVVGFYHRELDRVFVRRTPPRSREELIEQQGIVAHEVHHALQEQHFEVPELADLDNDDERLALLALVEGDAMVAMGAYFGSAYGAPIGRTLRQITDFTEKVEVEELDRGRDRDEKLDRALALTRGRLTFPYFEGARFVTDIYRAGGFPHVDKLYARPPVSTEQILHAEKYVAGEWPTPVAPPVAPPGYRVVVTEQLGELQTRILLSQCLAPESANDAAAGWAGDRFAVVVDGSGHLGLLWSTVWDDEAEAEAFERAITGAGACFHPNRLGEAGSDVTVTASLRTARRERRVAVVRGFEQGAEPILEALLKLPGEPPAATPVFDVTIPPRRPLPEPQLGRVDGDVFRSDWLGLVGRVPAGMTYQVGGEDTELVIKRPDILVVGGLVLSDRIASQRFNDLAFAGVGETFQREVAAHGLSLYVLGRGRATTPLGEGLEQTWQVGGTPVQIRMILVPICAGTGSIIFVQAYEDAYARVVLDGWVGSFRFLAGRNIPVCDRLDPK